VRGIIESCQPRQGIIEGTFNPEIFTASLSQLDSHYRGRGGQIDNLYIDAAPNFPVRAPTRPRRDHVSDHIRASGT